MSIVNAKAVNRIRAMAARSRARAAAGPDAGERIAAAFLESVPVPPDAVVAGYWARGDEADLMPLLSILAARGVACALPVVVGRDRPLAFRAWEPELALVAGRFGIPEPPAAAPEVRPDIVLVPLLAFDRAGHRLGSGGGYYDRTLAALREAGGVVAVGVGFAAQEVACLPAELHDQRLDWLVTENGVIRMGTRKRAAAKGSKRRASTRTTMKGSRRR